MIQKAIGIGQNTREDILNLQLVRGCHVEVYKSPFVALWLFVLSQLKDDKDTRLYQRRLEISREFLNFYVSTAFDLTSSQASYVQIMQIFMHNGRMDLIAKHHEQVNIRSFCS